MGYSDSVDCKRTTLLIHSVLFVVREEDDGKNSSLCAFS